MLEKEKLKNKISEEIKKINKELERKVRGNNIPDEILETIDTFEKLFRRMPMIIENKLNNNSEYDAKNIVIEAFSKLYVNIIIDIMANKISDIIAESIDIYLKDMEINIMRGQKVYVELNIKDLKSKINQENIINEGADVIILTGETMEDYNKLQIK